MVIGKIKFSIYLKLFFVFSYAFYAFFMSPRDSNEIIISRKMSQKDFLLGEVCLSILGGSNAKWGVSAEQLNSKYCAVKNYGVDFEGGTFENYTKWFSKDLKSQFIIYSSYLSYSNDIYYQGNLNIFPVTSIMSKIKMILMNNSKSSEAEYDLFGDLVYYDCQVPVRPFEFKRKEFLRNNELIAIELNRRLRLIREITETKEIFVRIPPVYINDEVLETYISSMKQRIEVFREMGINVIETSIASSDKSLFCDVPHHPNAKGRYFFTNELKEKMKIH